MSCAGIHATGFLSRVPLSEAFVCVLPMEHLEIVNHAEHCVPMAYELYLRLLHDRSQKTGLFGLISKWS